MIYLASPYSHDDPQTRRLRMCEHLPSLAERRLRGSAKADSSSAFHAGRVSDRQT
jgi:hypothetical protein